MRRWRAKPLVWAPRPTIDRGHAGGAVVTAPPVHVAKRKALKAPLLRQALRPAATAAIIAVHFLPPTARTGRIGLGVKRPIVAVAVAAVGLCRPAAVALAVSPKTAPIGNLLRHRWGADRGRHGCIERRGGRRGRGTERA